MEVPQHFCVRWNSYKSNLQTAFPKLLTSEHFVDVTLACEKQFIKCHKIVLSACSVYFESLLINNPCQHPIIFMKDVEFWEIKALVEFMYKGEVNVSQNQLDSLLKSAESLQIRGLSGAKQFVNLEQTGDTSYEHTGKRNKSDIENEDEDERSKRKRKRNEDDEKCIQITSIKGSEDVLKENKEIKKENESPKIIEEETIEEEYNYETTFIDLKKEEDEEIEEYSQEVYYPDHNVDPGPSGMAGLLEGPSLEKEEPARKDRKGKRKRIEMKKASARRSCYKQYTMASMWAALEKIEQGLSVYRASLEFGVPRKTLRNWMKKYNIMSYFDIQKQQREKQNVFMLNLCSLALNHVECVMEHEKSKASSPTRKTQQRHQEHNYTNPSVSETSGQKPETGGEKPEAGENHKTKSPGIRLGNASQYNSSHRMSGQSSSSASDRHHHLEAKNKVMKKDVFNRIRRSEEELQKAAEMVRGGMTFQTASDTFNIPISTIRFYMARRGILPQRRRGRGSSGVRDDDLIHPPFEIIHYRLPDIDKPL